MVELSGNEILVYRHLPQIKITTYVMYNPDFFAVDLRKQFYALLKEGAI